MKGLIPIAEVGELALQGLTKAQIAERMGLKVGTVSTYLAEARALGMAAPLPHQNACRWTKRLSAEARAALQPHRRKREMSLTQLLVAIVEAVARDGLVDAVLDDGAGDEGPDA